VSKEHLLRKEVLKYCFEKNKFLLTFNELNTPLQMECSVRGYGYECKNPVSRIESLELKSETSVLSDEQGVKGKFTCSLGYF